MSRSSHPFPQAGLVRSVAPTAAACAGLRRSLLSEWREAFPIEHSPFQPLARRLGGSLREVLHHCQTLVAEGATQGLRVDWHPDLQRVGVRMAVRGIAWPFAHRPTGAEPTALTTWNAIESITRFEGVSVVPDPPAGWVDLHAVDRAHLRQQIDRLRQSTPGVDWLEAPLLKSAEPCRCHEDGGPCADPVLASRCEQGLDLVAHPYCALASELGRTEREVVRALKRWRHSGRLASLGLAAPHAAGESLVFYAALDDRRLDIEVLASLATRPGVVSVSRTEMSERGERWPWGTLVQLAVPAHAGPALLARTLHASGLSEGVRAVVTVRQFRVRQAPMLFATDAATHRAPA